MGGDNKGDTTKKPSQQQQQQSQTQNQQQISSSSPKEHQLDDHHQSTISAPLFIPVNIPTSSPFDQVPFDQTATNNPKRARYTAGQWKLLPSPSSQPKLTQVPGQITVLPSAESSPSLSLPAPQPLNTTASSSDTASSPSQSLPERTAEAGESNPVQHQQFRKGKYVSPVWKPNEMLWLARAWRVQYQTSSRPVVSDHQGGDIIIGGVQGKGKTRADKDKEVAEFLQRHGVNRDAKTAGTKWDNMLGEFRKVYEWERGGEREQIGKSYFRLSPYERKLHRLPASFDEEVFEELSQFMGSRMRSSSSTSTSLTLPTQRIMVNPSVGDESLNRTRRTPSDDNQFPLSARTKQLVVASGGGETYCSYGGRFDQGIGDANVVGPSKEVRRIGKMRMTWEESVSLWAEEGESQRGRVKMMSGSLSFLNADELTYFDEAMVGSTLEGFEEGALKGFSVDRFVPGQQVKVFGRKKPLSVLLAHPEKVAQQQQQQQLPFAEPSIRSIPPWEFQDPTDYYVGCLRISAPTIPSLFELSWYLQEPPPEELRFPLRKDVYRDLPQGKELFFTISTELLDCRAITYDILSPIFRTNPSLTSTTATCRDSFIGLWDDCINRIVSKFCSLEMTLIRKPTIFTDDDDQLLQDQWPNITGFVRNLCLWRGEETDQLREGQINPSNSIVEKLLWTYSDIPYILGYYAVGFSVTFCALSRAQERIIRTDLHTVDLSSPCDRLKALVPCYRIASLLPLLADRCYNIITNSSKMHVYSDFERIEHVNTNTTGHTNVTEMTPNTTTRFDSTRRKWTAVKEIYDFLDHRIPHAEFIHLSSDHSLSLVFKPRGIKSKPQTCEQLVEALKCVTKALVALHDLSFMHRDLSWDKVMHRITDRGEIEWFVCGFEEAVGSPQIYPHQASAAARGAHAPEMERGLHGVKVDVWGLGNLVRTCFSPTTVTVPKMLRELQQMCLEQNPEQRPTAADCYHHLLQLQSSLQAVSGSASGGGGVVM